MNLKQKFNVLKDRTKWLAIKYEFEIIMFSLMVGTCLFVGVIL